MREVGDFIVFHHTSEETAQAILNGGFQNSRGSYFSNRTWTGVWLSANPEIPSGKGDSVLAIKLSMTEKELAGWEWTSEGHQSRGWLIPSGVLNQRISSVAVEEHQSLLTAA